MERFLAILDSKIERLDQDYVRRRFVEPEYMDLFEDGLHQVVRSLTDERREHIASILKNSLTNDQLKHIEKKRLLGILGELNDLEILILESYARRSFTDRQRFKEAHPAISPPRPGPSGPPRCTRDTLSTSRTSVIWPNSVSLASSSAPGLTRGLSSTTRREP